MNDDKIIFYRETLYYNVAIKLTNIRNKSNRRMTLKQSSTARTFAVKDADVKK